MIRFKYSLSSFTNFLSELASALKTTVQDNTLQLPSYLGTGYFKSVDLPNGLQALLIDCTLAEDLLIERERTNLEFYVFISDSASNVNRYYMHIDEEQTTGRHTSPSVMYLLSFLSNLQQFATAGTMLRSVRIIMSREWLAKYLRIDQMDEVLQRYLALKTRSVHIRDIDLDSRMLMNEIFNPPEQGVPESSYLQTRITKMLENFFGWMYQQMSNLQFTLGIPRDEIDKLVEVEAELLQRVQQRSEAEPPKGKTSMQSTPPSPPPAPRSRASSSRSPARG